MLSGGAEILVYFESVNRIIVNFVVKLILDAEGTYFEVMRFDSGHNCPHKDVLDIRGKVIRKVWFPYLDNKQGLDLAIRDMKENADLYIARFKEWLGK
jgi:hypothetical protein